MKLLELLASEKRWFKTDEITKQIGYSNKTIHSDISFIHDFLPKNWHLEAKKGKGVQLHVPPSASIDEVNSFLFQQSYVFKALHELLDQKVTTVLNLADKLYVSATSILPILKNVENYLKKFNLQLNKRPLKIVGDEIQIIMLCYELHLEVYGYYEWPFQEYPESYFFNFIQNIEKALNRTLSLNSRKEICYFTTILLKRKEQKNSIKLQKKFISQYVNSSHYHKMTSVYEEFKNEHHISWNTEEKILLTMAIKCAKYIIPNIHKEKEEIFQHLEKKDIPVYNAVKDFIITLETKLNRDLMQDEDLIFELMMYFRRKVYQLHFLSMFHRMEQHTSTYIEQKYSATFLTIQAV
ncbi:helix-turn-helix domain-containing protein, partial [Bacillus mycoides]|uniref:helix-turn-helix domain-containing protein n=1 Tax=Bacillus mycoides TaxID=1405 RepID=UPI003D655D21